HRGGSALLFATLLDAIGRGRIITIDLEKMEGRPSHPRITYVTGSSVTSETLGLVAEAASGAQRTMVVLDSDHSERHVHEELLAYCEFVTRGCYLICEDTNVNGHPVYRKHGPGPMEALERFLAEHPEFVADRERERVGITAHPKGFLRRL